MDFTHLRITFNKPQITTLQKTPGNFEELRTHFTSQTSKMPFELVTTINRSKNLQQQRDNFNPERSYEFFPQETVSRKSTISFHSSK